MKILIKNINVVNYDNENKCDIIIDDDKISKMGEGLNEEGMDKIIDGEGKYAFPGFCDVHCHLRDPGFTSKEDIITGQKSAAKGGFTRIVAMPNTNPVVDNETVVDYIYKKANENKIIKVYQAGAVSKGLEGKELAEIGKMKEKGIVAITDDGQPVFNGSLMKKAMLYASMFDLPVISHCEDKDLVDGGSMNEGYMSTYLGLRGITKAAEESQVARDMIIAKNNDTPVHITHISTKGSVDMIRFAKSQNVKVTCDTCPHYFSLTDKAVDGYNTNAKMNPPLREQEDVDAIIEGLCDGTIDMIITDHAPHREDDKNCEFDKAANGIIGFETAFNLAYKCLVKAGHMTLNNVVKLMSYNPNKFMKFDGGEIKEGMVADIVIADLNTTYKYKKEDIVSKSKNTPYVGYEFNSKIEHVICDGNILF